MPMIRPSSDLRNKYNEIPNSATGIILLLMYKVIINPLAEQDLICQGSPYIPHSLSSKRMAEPGLI